MSEESEVYSEEYVESLRENLNWSTAILTVLLQEAGGAVEVSREDIEGIDLNRASASVKYDEAREMYIIEGNYEPDES